MQVTNVSVQLSNDSFYRALPFVSPPVPASPDRRLGELKGWRTTVFLLLDNRLEAKVTLVVSEQRFGFWFPHFQNSLCCGDHASGRRAGVSRGNPASRALSKAGKAPHSPLQMCTQGKANVSCVKPLSFRAQVLPDCHLVQPNTHSMLTRQVMGARSGQGHSAHCGLPAAAETTVSSEGRARWCENCLY